MGRNTYRLVIRWQTYIEESGLRTPTQMDGTVASSPKEVLDIMMSHFAQVEGATLMQRMQAVTAQTSYLLQTRKLPNVMPKSVLTASFAQASQRAPGPNGLSNAIYKRSAQTFSDFVYPLVFKMQLNAEEPLAFKGGEAVDIVKTHRFQHLQKHSGVYGWRTTSPNTITLGLEVGLC